MINHTEYIEKEFQLLLRNERSINQVYSELWTSLNAMDPKDAKSFLKKLNQIAPKTPFYSALNNLGLSMMYLFGAKYLKAMSLSESTYDQFVALGDIEGQGAVKTMMQLCARSLGRLDVAQDNIKEALDKLENCSEGCVFKNFRLVALYQASELCIDLKKLDDAKEHIRKGLELEKNYKTMRLRLLNNLAKIHVIDKNWDAALNAYNEILEALKDFNHPPMQGRIYSDIGNFYIAQKDFPNALKYLTKSLKIRQENNLHDAIISSHLLLADLYFNMEDMDKSLEYANFALVLAKKLKVLPKLFKAHHILSTIHEKLGDIKTAYKHFKEYTSIKETVHNQDVATRIAQINSSHDLEVMQKEKEIIRLKNVELKGLLDEIDQSLQYAKRIQTAILPSDKHFKNTFPESFIIYKPRDVVAGDFYWMEELEDRILFAVADCTGHGVPGALVSVLCNNALNRSVREFDLKETDEILNKTREIVINEFEKSEAEVQDGMDIALISIQNLNSNKKTLQFSGAHNPLWIIRDSELIIVKADKQPIGKYDFAKPYTSHKMELKKDDSIYIFSDGYQDQFGGERGKKLMSKGLKSLLLEASQVDINKQKTLIEDYFETWKGKHRQIDDVCLIGVKI